MTVKRRARETRGADAPPARSRFRVASRWLRGRPEQLSRGDVQGRETDPSPPVIELDAVLAEVVVVAAPATAELPVEPPREWNIWDLERRARERAGDAARDQEWAALFMHLRQFANADGVLPMHFDGLVRESFSELIEAA